MTQLHFSAALDVRPGITSIIGSGGKTTLLRTLAAELSDHAPVLLTTTTHFLPFPEYPLIDTASMGRIMSSAPKTRLRFSPGYSGRQRICWPGDIESWYWAAVCLRKMKKAPGSRQTARR